MNRKIFLVALPLIAAACSPSKNGGSANSADSTAYTDTVAVNDTLIILQEPDAEDFVADNGYRYSFLANKQAVELAAGGQYHGVVEVPLTVNYNQQTYTVAGIGAKAFAGLQDVTKVVFDSETQYITPGAYIGSGIASADTIYPILVGGSSPSSKTFLCPMDYSGPAKVGNWRSMIDTKGNVHLVSFQGEFDWSCDNRDYDYDGAVFSLASDQEAADMDANNASAKLLAHNDYVGHHVFPAFSRDPMEMSVDFRQKMEELFQLKVEKASQVLKMQGASDAQLAVVEFEKDTVSAVATVAFAWVESNEIVATYKLTTDFDVNGFGINQYTGEKVYYSVWRVDDNGEYGVPIGAAVATSNDHIDVFLKHIGMEGTNCFILRIANGEMQQFHRFAFDGWYYNMC